MADDTVTQDDLLKQRELDYPTTPVVAAPAPGTTPMVVPPAAADDTVGQLLTQRHLDYPNEAKPTPVPLAPLTWGGAASDFGAGVLHGLQTLPRMAAQGMADVAGPGGWLERTTNGLIPGVGGSSDVMRVENAKEQAAAPKSGYGTAGTIVGQTIPTLPLMAGAGAITDAAIQGGARLLPTAIGDAVSGAGTFLAGGSGGAGSLGSRALQLGSRAVQGATQGIGATALSGNTDANSLGLGAATGGVAGAAIPLVVEAGSRVLGNTSDMGSAIAGFIKNAQSKFGIDLRATQVPDALPPTASAVKTVLSGIAGSGAGAETAPVLGQWRNAVATSAGILPNVGEDIPALTPSAISDAQRMNTATRGFYEQAPASLPDITTRLSPIVQGVTTVGGADSAVLGKTFKGIMDAADQGRSYGSILTSLDQQARLSGSPTVQRTIAATKSAVQDAIQDDFDRTPQIRFGESTNGGFYSRLRVEQHNLDILKTAQVGADGQITPQALREVTNQAAPYQGDTKNYAPHPDSGFRYSPTGNELNELSDIGTGLNEPRSSLLKWSKYLEYPAAAATHMLSGAGLINLPVTAGAVGAVSGGANLANRYLASKGLVNRLVNNAGTAGPWANRLQPFVGAPAALTADALSQ